MAITGTGTQADPYIVDTWSDFVTAVGTSGAYVEVVPGAVWDANDIAPEGMPTVSVLATHIDGKGLEIKNARIDQNFLDCLSTTASSITVENISVTNFLASSSVIYKRGNYSLYFKNLVLSGKQISGNTIYHYAGNSIYFNSNADNGCGFFIDYNNENDTYLINYANNVSFRDCIFNLNGKVILGTSPNPFRAENCYIFGEIKECYFNSNSSKNILNAYADAIAGGGTNVAVINADKCDNITTGTSVTDEQMKDAAYLNSIGFPIGVDQND